MKICFITKSISDLGGVQRVLSILANELVKDYTIDILCTDSEVNIDRSIYNLNKDINVIINNELVNEKKVIYKCINKVIKVINNRTGIFNKEKYFKVISKVYYPDEVRRKVIDLLNSNNYDIVIGVEGYYSLLLGSIAEELKCKTIGWQHNSFDAYLKTAKRYYYNQDVLFDKYLNRLDSYIVLNEYDKKKFYNEKGIESKVIFNAKSFVSSDISDLSGEFFLAAGRLNYQKGFDLLIESFKRYVENKGRWNLIIVGDGEEKDNLEKLIYKYDLGDRVEIKPFTNNIQEYFLKAGALTLSSRWEGMPMIVLESLEMGVPIISYDISAINAILDNTKQGLIVKSFKVDEFAKAMNLLSESNELNRKLAEGARKKSREFEIEIIADKWRGLFEEIVN